ncbi:MAG: hypothetical protein ACYDA8_14730 [Deferrisomatales bacterium]
MAPHHGAANALCPEWLAAAGADAVLISAGGSPGLPSPAFEAAAGAAGARVLSTHDSGCLHAWLGPRGAGAEPAVR